MVFVLCVFVFSVLMLAISPEKNEVEMLFVLKLSKNPDETVASREEMEFVKMLLV